MLHSYSLTFKKYRKSTTFGTSSHFHHGKSAETPLWTPFFLIGRKIIATLVDENCTRRSYRFENASHFCKNFLDLGKFSFFVWSFISLIMRVHRNDVILVTPKSNHLSNQEIKYVDMEMWSINQGQYSIDCKRWSVRRLHPNNNVVETLNLHPGLNPLSPTSSKETL